MSLLSPSPVVTAVPLNTRGPFLTIPQELAEHILKFCHAREVARFAETCREMYELIYSSKDKHLWRELFLLHPFDDPRSAINFSPQIPTEELDWKGELQRRILAEQAIASIEPSLDDNDQSNLLVSALSTLIAAVCSALPVSKDGRTDSRNVTWVQKTLMDSHILRDPPPHKDPAVDQLLSRLRCYFGLTHEDGESEGSNERLQLTRARSRCFVYDLRNYRQETYWGPYRRARDGKVEVNWEHVEHIMNVVILNIREVPSHWDEIWPRWGLDSTRAYSGPNTDNRKPHDWAGVEGLWRRVVCFMDYRDLFAFNFSSVHHGPYSAQYFMREPRFAEAVRLMEYELKVKELTDTPPARGDDPYDPRFPPIHFEGVCHGAHSSTGLVEGTVRMHAPGVVRWNFIDQVTAYDGSVNSWRFSAEGVQVGNIGGAIGMAGIWTVALHEDVGDPAGPFWMWKVEDPLPRDMFMIPIY